MGMLISGCPKLILSEYRDLATSDLLCAVHAQYQVFLLLLELQDLCKPLYTVLKSNVIESNCHHHGLLGVETYISKNLCW